jgi:hypothetical protein
MGLNASARFLRHMAASRSHICLIPCAARGTPNPKAPSPKTNHRTHAMSRKNRPRARTETASSFPPDRKDLPPWLPTGQQWNDLPAAVRQAALTVLVPAYRKSPSTHPRNVRSDVQIGQTTPCGPTSRPSIRPLWRRRRLSPDRPASRWQFKSRSSGRQWNKRRSGQWNSIRLGWQLHCHPVTGRLQQCANRKTRPPWTNSL